MLNRVKVETNVKNNLPEFYSVDGPMFVLFLETYFRWMENNKLVAPAKELPDILDIDETEAEFLEHFKKQYMAELPKDVIGNQRLLQKHILDLYRSKGSYDGFRLLFRLLYNQDIDIYIPGSDLFRTSASKWLKRQYIEVSETSLNPTFEGQLIKGNISGAEAVVESFEKLIYNGRKNSVLFASNIKGTFKIGEELYVDDNTLTNLPKIQGSVVSLNVAFSSTGFTVGDLLTDSVNPDLKFYVSEIDPLNLAGIILPTIVEDGSGYRQDFTTLTFEANTGDTGGTGGSFTPVINEQATLFLTEEGIAAYANTDLANTDYGMPGAGTEDANSIIADALDFQTYNIGFIERVITVDPGSGYELPGVINAVDENVARLELTDEIGTLGNNAIITTAPGFGANRTTDASVVTSLFNVSEGSVTLTNGEKTVSGSLVFGPIGYMEGYYVTRDSHPSNKKYLQDSFYYQEYSYDIRVDQAFDKYFDILKKTVHPSGIKPFGNIRVKKPIEITSTITSVVTENA